MFLFMDKALRALQKKVLSYERNILQESYIANYSPSIVFQEVDGLFDITFFGEGYDDNPQEACDEDFGGNYAFCNLLDLLAQQRYADKVLSLNFTGPDMGANGLRSWVFNRLVNAEVCFPQLKSFQVTLTDPGDHNQSLIDDNGCLEENGMVARLVARMPAIEFLAIPSAPNADFFTIPLPDLKRFIVQAGMDHQDFIANLAKSSCMPALFSLDFADMMYNWNEQSGTSFEDFAALFRSALLRKGFHFKLRFSKLTQAQLFELQKMNGGVQFLVIPSEPAYYVSHAMRN